MQYLQTSKEKALAPAKIVYNVVRLFVLVKLILFIEQVVR